MCNKLNSGLNLEIIGKHQLTEYFATIFCSEEQDDQDDIDYDNNWATYYINYTDNIININRDSLEIIHYH